MNKPVNITLNIHTPDGASFRRSQHQIMARAASAVARRRTMGNHRAEPDVPNLNAILAVSRDPELFAKAPDPFDWGKVAKAIKAILAGKDDWK